jgi:hypothetical protein
VLDDRDCRDIGKGLRGLHVSFLESPFVGSEQVEGANGQIPEVHGHGMDGAKSSGDRSGSKVRPAVGRAGQVLIDDRFSRAKAVRARALLGLFLEQLEDVHLITRRRNNAKVSSGRYQHHARGCNVKYLDGSIGEQRQEFDDVKVVNQRVGQTHQGLGDEGFS